ncbi:uncharacterized protein WCC33_018905 [Rhinophrynus dorsalis]
MCSARPNSLEFTQAGKPLRRSTVGGHLSFSPGSQGIPLLKGDSQSDFQSHTSNKRTTGNEHKLEKLQEENIKLKQELEDLRNQYKQLIEEGKNECFDKRRVSLLKSQVMQLERQVMLLAEGLSSRASLLLELDNSLQPVLNKLRCLVANEEHSSDVPVSRAELIRMIEICQAMRDKLHRNHQATSVENLSLPWILSGRQATKNPITLVDLCFGKMENLNLLYVSSLEEKLSTLFRHLHTTKETLSLIIAPGTESPGLSHQILPNVIYARLINHLTTCSQSLEECCRDLLTMTLIVPSAPWAKIDCPVIQEFTVENVLAVLPAFPKGAPHQRAKRAAEALVKAANYSRLMAVQQLVCPTSAPVHSISASVSPANILFALRHCSLMLLLCDEALSKLGKEFFLSLEHSLKSCGEQRDKSAYEIEKFQHELDQSLETLKSLKRERKEKGASSKNSSIKSGAESVEETRLSSLDQGLEKLEISPQPLDHRRKLSQPFPSSKERESLENQGLQENQCSGKVKNQRSKSLQRSKSVKNPLRPPWQD